MRRTHPTRRGFTLIELLVAAALSLVVMTVLSLAFQTGMQTLSHLKSVITLAEQLRAAEGVMRRDLLAYHLEADQGLPVRVSDGGGVKGFFSFSQGGMVQTAGGPQGYGSVDEKPGVGNADSPTSYRTYAVPSNPTLFGRAWMDTLAFTVRLDGTRPQEVFATPAVGDPNNVNGSLLARVRAIDPSALLPETQSADPTSTQLTSKWAEVSYLLIPSGGTPRVFTSDEGGVTALPLYTLYRRQRVLADRTVTSPTTPGPTSFGLADALNARGIAMASNGPLWSVLGPEAVASPANRLGGSADMLAPTVPTSLPNSTPITLAQAQQDLQRRGYPIPSGTAEYGSDVLLNNVVSMTVRPVFSHAVPQEIIDFVKSNGLSTSSTPILSPDGLTSTGDIGQFISYTPRNMLFPGVKPGSGAGGYDDPNAYPRFLDTVGGGFSGTFIVNGSASVVAPFKDFKLKAIEIKLRVYDAKNKTTRQMTVLQDL